MTHSSLLTELLMDVKKNIFAVDPTGELEFTNQEIDFFSTSGQARSIKAFVPAICPEDLGDRRFKQRHGLKYPYIAGAMANGITSAAMVKTMAQNGMMAFFGAGGLSIEKIEENIIDLKTTLQDKPFGFNLIHSLGDPAHEMATVQLYLKHHIRRVSAAAFMRMTPALVYYRVKGIHEDAHGNIITPNHIIAKVDSSEIMI